MVFHFIYLIEARELLSHTAFWAVSLKGDKVLKNTGANLLSYYILSHHIPLSVKP